MTSSPFPVACPPDDRAALTDLAIALATAFDDIGNTDGIVALFTPDAVYDISDMGWKAFHGHDDIRAFFDETFAKADYFIHYLTNVRITAHDGDTASATAYVHAFAQAQAQAEIEIRGRYGFDFARTAEGWRIARFAVTPFKPSGAT